MFDKVLRVVHTVVKEETRPSVRRIRHRFKLGMPMRKALELLLMADLALAIGEGLQIRSQSVMLLMAGATGQLLRS